MQQTLAEFNYWLNSEMTYVPTSVELKISYEKSITAEMDSYPALNIFDKQIQIIAAQQELQKRQIKPEYQIGINNQSIVGWQTINNTNRYFDASKRFTSGTFSVAIPLYKKTNIEKVKSYEVLKQQNLLAQKAKANELAQHQKYWQLEITNAQKTISLYETNLLANAETIYRTANLQLNYGEIDYFKWVLLVNQSLQIKKEYLQYIQQYNNAIIEFQKNVNQ